MWKTTMLGTSNQRVDPEPRGTRPMRLGVAASTAMGMPPGRSMGRASKTSAWSCARAERACECAPGARACVRLTAARCSCGSCRADEGGGKAISGFRAIDCAPVDRTQPKAGPQGL